MPNLAVRHGAGVVVLATRGLDEPARRRCCALLRPLGAVVLPLAPTALAEIWTSRLDAVRRRFDHLRGVGDGHPPCFPRGSACTTSPGNA